MPLSRAEITELGLAVAQECVANPSDNTIVPYGELPQTSVAELNTIDRHLTEWGADQYVVNNVTEAFGRTPLIKLSKLAQAYGLKCELYAKVEFTSAGGSIKDRIGRRMIEEAEAKGELNTGDIVIEPTSGNTGIGLAVTCAVKNYQLVVIMPAKMSQEKENVLTALGAIVLRTRSTARWYDRDSHFGVAYALRDKINAQGNARAIILDQYKNQANLNTHYYETAEEILKQTQGTVDMFIAGPGTGGTISGVGKRLKDTVAGGCTIIGVDPITSILADAPGSIACPPEKKYELEGVGYDFYPRVFNHSIVDRWIKCSDREAFSMAREAARLEGLLCGGSSGAILHGAMIAAKDLSETQRVVAMIPDAIRNYLSKFVNDDWMLTHCIFRSPKEHRKYRPNHSLELNASFSTLKVLKVLSTICAGDALQLLLINRYDYGAILKSCDMTLMGLISREELCTIVMDRKGKTQLGEIARPHTIYPYKNGATQSPEAIEEARLALLSMNEFKCPALTVIPRSTWPLVANMDDLKEKRNLLMQQNFANLDIEVITKHSFLKTCSHFS